MIEIHNLDQRGMRFLLPELVDLLADVVDNGASVGFLAPLASGDGRDYWNGVAQAIADGSRVMLVAMRGGDLAGTVQLDLCQKANGGHRAEVQKLMVAGSARRAGVASLLMRAAEAQAQERKRGLLFLDTEAGSGAEGLYQSLGYTRVGELPDFACNPGGQWRPTAIYFKTLFAPRPVRQAA
jgi:acetyltransferase